MATLAFLVCDGPPDYDVAVRGGTVYDGSRAAPFVRDVGIVGETIEALGDLSGATATTVDDVEGLAVAPGFINMLSWATESLIIDGRSQGDIRQRVTLGEARGEAHHRRHLTTTPPMGRP